MAQLTVKAASGIRVPVEGSPREYITDSTAVSVERTPYYLRRLAECDLLEDDETPAAPGGTVDAVSALNAQAQQADVSVSEVAAKPGKKKPSSESTS
ncbi:hypothetical protein [Serratia fonticola]